MIFKFLTLIFLLISLEAQSVTTTTVTETDGKRVTKESSFVIKLVDNKNWIGPAVISLGTLVIVGTLIGGFKRRYNQNDGGSVQIEFSNKGKTIKGSVTFEVVAIVAGLLLIGLGIAVYQLEIIYGATI